VLELVGPWFVVADALVLALFIFLLGFFVSVAALTLWFALRFRPSRRVAPNPNPGPVAIVVPVRDDPSIFNSLPYLEAQDYPDFTVLIVDDSEDSLFRAELDAHKTNLTAVVRRDRVTGRKAGALNFALGRLASRPPEYVVILDADHRPPRDFLARAVTAIEESRADCVSGYQKHDIGSTGFFGLFYRASQAATVMNYKARCDTGFGPVFSGSAAIFRYEWLRTAGFDETSVTEDWELSLRSHIQGGFRIVVREDLWVSAAVPVTIWDYLRQQLRWTEGATRDFRKHALPMLRSRIDVRSKVGLSYHGLLNMQPPAFLLFSVALPLLLGPRLPFLASFGLLVFLGLAWAWPLVRASTLEGFTHRQLAAVLACGLAVAYILVPLGTYAFFSGLIRKSSPWVVTPRRG